MIIKIGLLINSPMTTPTAANAVNTRHNIGAYVLSLLLVNSSVFLRCDTDKTAGNGPYFYRIMYLTDTIIFFHHHRRLYSGSIRFS
jgi:hypothetical protein